MNELIKIENKNGKETVNARDLYNFLEVQTRFNDWIKNRIFKYCFVEGQDYYSLTEKLVSGNNADCISYYLSLDMAKELSMVENNEKGRQARFYFIECEKKLSRPMSLEEMTLQVITGMTAKVKELENKIIEDKPKVDFYNEVISSDDTMDIGTVAKTLKICIDNKIGSKKLFTILRDQNVLMSNNIPYQQYSNYGYFKVIENKYTMPDGSIHISPKTKVYQKGIEFINKLLSKVVK